MTKRYFQLLALLYVPFAIFVIVGAIFTYGGERDRELQRLQLQESTEVALGVSSLQSNFEMLFGDVVYLANEPGLRQAHSLPRAVRTSALTENYLIFSKTKQVYAEIRWIDEQGLEQVRVDNRDGRISVTPAEKLQDKSQRYYVKGTMLQPPGGVYVSPLDLTVDYDVVETPFRPVIRAGTPVYDPAGKRQGVLMLNLDGRKLIDDVVRAFSGSSTEHVMLLNTDGYWLHSPRKEDEWAFMFGRKNTLSERYPEVWQKIAQSRRGQFQNDDGLWTFQHFSPKVPEYLKAQESAGTQVSASSDPNGLIVLSRIPVREIDATLFNAKFKIWGSANLLLLISLIGSVVVARVWLSRESAQTELGRLNDRNILLASLGEGVIGIDRNGCCVFFNQAAARMLELEDAAITGQPLATLIDWRVDASSDTAAANTPFELGSGAVEYTEASGWIRTNSGATLPVWLTMSPATENDGRVAAVVSLQDITELKQAEAEAFDLAYYDPLTGLPNRRMLLDRLAIAISAMVRSKQLGALIFIDLDQFKLINEAYGHQHGDHLLIELGRLLGASVRVEDTVAHLGADHFLIMLQNLAEGEEAAAARAEDLAAKIVLRVGNGMEIRSQRTRVTVSVGIALIADQKVDAGEILMRAELAMNHAKEDGANMLRFFDPVMQARIDARVTLELEMRAGLVAGEFEAYYQPKIDASRQIVSLEALVRWHHPQRGMVSPVEFIPVAEDSGLIMVLGAQVLRQACMQLALWSAQGMRPEVSIAVNVSARQFRNPVFIDEVRGILTETGANPAKLLLELTESMLADNVDEVVTKMNALRAAGVRFSLDDFGTGYSSLSYLKRLPLYQVKIDKSFVSDMLVDPNDAALVRTIIAMGKSLGLTIVAEGVETEAQWAMLCAEGCDQGQGYLFSRPVPAGELAQRWLSDPANAASGPQSQLA